MAPRVVARPQHLQLLGPARARPPAPRTAEAARVSEGVSAAGPGEAGRVRRQVGGAALLRLLLAAAVLVLVAPLLPVRVLLRGLGRGPGPRVRHRGDGVAGEAAPARLQPPGLARPSSLLQRHLGLSPAHWTRQQS